MKRLEEVYASLPAAVQDVAVTAQGWVYRQQRYGRAFREEHALLQATEMAGALQLELIQTARLKRMLAHAAANVPYYRERVKPEHYERLRAGEWSGFFRIPPTPKSAVRRDPNCFLLGGRMPAGSIAWNTSGTTGTPMTLFYSRDSVSRQYAFVERYREQAGVSRFARRAQFTGKLIVPGDGGRSQGRGRFWRYDWANRCLLLSTVHLSRETIPAYLAAIRRFEPEYLTGYPSAIALLAQHVLRRPQDGLPLKAVLTSAETLLEEQRLAIGSAFGSRVYDQYGQTEMQSFWFECRYGRMHAHPLFGVTEILRPDGRPCEPGETGDVVLTGLINEAMPLLRYEVGDRAAWSEETRCPCGRQMAIVAAIEGRRDDYLYSRERGWLGRMDPALKGVEGLLECQFVQEVPEQVEVRYVALPSLTAGDLGKLRRNLRDRLGDTIEIRMVEMAAIPRGANGKFRTVVSKLGREFRMETAGLSAQNSGAPEDREAWQ